MSLWSPQSDHVSQLEHANASWDGLGNNDCGPGCLTRYGREAGILPLGVAIHDQLSHVAEEIRGYPDGPNNGYVSVDQMQTWLGNHNTHSHYTEDWATARAAAWSICLVDAFQLSPPQYPQDWSWLGANTGLGDHFVLWLPQWRGTIDWYNDPLAYDLGEVDNQYDLGAMEAAFRAALVLPSTHHGEDPAPIPAPPKPAPIPIRRMVSQPAGLKAIASHGGPNIYNIPKHGQLLDLGVRFNGFSQVQYLIKVGWVPTNIVVNLA